MFINLTKKVSECKNDDYVLLLASVSDGDKKSLQNVLLKKKNINELIEQLKKFNKEEK